VPVDGSAAGAEESSSTNIEVIDCFVEIVMTEARALNRDVAKQRPHAVFQTPFDIVGEVLLTRGEKLGTLERWRQNILSELCASDDGMATRGYSSKQLKILQAIDDATVQLNDLHGAGRKGTNAPSASWEIYQRAGGN